MQIDLLIYLKYIEVGFGILNLLLRYT